MLAMKKLTGLIIFILIVATVSALLFFYGRGYRIDFDDKQFKPTGVLTITSKPTNAKVFINNEEKGNTNMDLSNLSPGKYTLTITKDGYSTWEKEILIKKEEVNEIEVTLFPRTPSLTSITFTGVNEVAISPDGKKVVFLVQEKGQQGIWSLDLSRNTIPIFTSQALNKLISDSEKINYSAAKLQISPDSKRVLIEIPGDTQAYFLLDLDSQNNSPNPLFIEEFQKTQDDWAKESLGEINSKIKGLGQEAILGATGLSNITFSPDGDRFAGKNKNSNFAVFDSKPGPVPNTKEQIYTLPKANKYVWFSDSKHLIGTKGENIFIVDVDGQNIVSIYSGAFDSKVISPWLDGSKILILANFNSALNKLANFYAIELR